MRSIVEVFFGEGAELGGPLGSLAREGINEALLKITEDLRQPLLDFFCKNRDLGQLARDFKKAAFSRGYEDRSISKLGDSNLPKLKLRENK
jgi:hypothetical protein